MEVGPDGRSAPTPTPTPPPVAAGFTLSKSFASDSSEWRLTMSATAQSGPGPISMTLSDSGNLRLSDGAVGATFGVAEREPLIGTKPPQLVGADANFPPVSWGGGRTARTGVQYQDGYVGARYASQWRGTIKLPAGDWVVVLSLSGFLGYRVPEQQRPRFEQAVARAPVPAHAPAPAPRPASSPVPTQSNPQPAFPWFPWPPALDDPPTLPEGADVGDLLPVLEDVGLAALFSL
jgi:hypothetical protein